jgi:nitrogen regulatory protein PII
MSPRGGDVTTQLNESDLWMVQAMIQPFRLDAVTLALEDVAGFQGITVAECRGFGREKMHPEGKGVAAEDASFSRSDELVDFTPKLMLTIAVAGERRANAIVEALGRAAHTGNRGDGKIFVWPLARAVRVRTFEENENAV